MSYESLNRLEKQLADQKFHDRFGRYPDEDYRRGGGGGRRAAPAIVVIAGICILISSYNGSRAAPAPVAPPGSPEVDISVTAAPQPSDPDGLLLRSEMTFRGVVNESNGPDREVEVVTQVFFGAAELIAPVVPASLWSGTAHEDDCMITTMSTVRQGAPVSPTIWIHVPGAQSSFGLRQYDSGDGVTFVGEPARMDSGGPSDSENVEAYMETVAEGAQGGYSESVVTLGLQVAYDSDGHAWETADGGFVCSVR